MQHVTSTFDKRACCHQVTGLRKYSLKICHALASFPEINAFKPAKQLILLADIER